MDHMKHAVITHRLRLNDNTYIETYKGISYDKMIVSTTSNTDKAYLFLIKTNVMIPEFV